MATRRNDHEYTKRRDALKRRATRNNEACALCGQPIDYTLHYTHAMAFTADHITPVAAGGKMIGPLQPAHRGCNARKGDGTRAPKPKPTVTPVRATTTW